MDVFFNELSIKVAKDNNEACEWLEKLAKLGKLLKQIVESLEDNTFSFRRKEDFGQQSITENQTILEFLLSQFDFSDPIYIFLLGIFDAPYISDDDPQKTEYDLTNITINSKDYELTGIAAAYLKDSLVISLDSDIQWDSCQLNVHINRLNEDAKIITEQKHVKHASKEQHLINCHLQFLAQLYDWSSYKPEFNPITERQNILPLIDLYSLCLEENIDWDIFYHDLSKISVNERVGKIKVIAEKISRINGWQKATGSLEKRNSDRVIYTISNSSFIISVDTQHGEFEVHINAGGNNHLGAISFDGKKFKNKIDTRSLSL